MSVSITTFDLGWPTPEGHPVFSNINLSFNDERVGIVGRNGVGKTSLLKLLAGEREPTAGKIVVRGKVCMLRQIVQVEPDDSIASLFGLDGPLDLLRKAEEGRATMEELAEADWTLEARIVQAFARVGLDATPYSLLTSLSGGQRTRAAMAGVLLEDPDFLLLDEPSNNLDREGKRALVELLASWRGGAIIVSHDRDLLETMDAIVEMTTLGATRYGGNWSRYRERKVIELAAARHDLDTAERQMAEIERKSQVAIERKQRRDATGRRRGARGDLPRILAGARKERAENSGGEDARLAERLWQDATAATIAAKQQIERTETLLLTLPTTGLPAGKTVLDMHRVSAGYDKRSHCPKCQGAAARTWLAAREADLLPVGYFHVVFTVPSEIADIAWQNKAAVYDLLFRAAADTMLTIAADPKHLGARIGITAVLHTWGSALTHHPRVHMVVPGGGIALDGTHWVSSRPAFLLPVRVLGVLFRRLFLTRLLVLFDAGKLGFFGALAGLTTRKVFLRYLSPIRKKRWVVYAKALLSACLAGQSKGRPSPGRRRCWPISRATPTASPSRTGGSSPLASTV